LIRAITETAFIERNIDETRQLTIQWLKADKGIRKITEDNPITAEWHENPHLVTLRDVHSKEIRISLSSEGDKTKISFTIELANHDPLLFGSDWRYKILDYMEYIGSLDEPMFDRLISERDLQNLKNISIFMGVFPLISFFLGQLIFGRGLNYVYLILGIPLLGLILEFSTYYRLSKLKKSYSIDSCTEKSKSH
jgi:uncharacterized membrane protein